MAGPPKSERQGAAHGHLSFYWKTNRLDLHLYSRRNIHSSMDSEWTFIPVRHCHEAAH